MRVRDASGEELNADFDIEPQSYGIDVILHSRAGARGGQISRNPDYNEALELLLMRAAQVDGVLLSVAVDSAVALRSPAQDRIVPLEYPVDLAAHPDIGVLRKQITERQRTVLSRVVEGRGGNKHKRIRIALDLRAGAAELQPVLQQFGIGGAPELTRSYRRAKTDPKVTPADLFTLKRPGFRDRSGYWVTGSRAGVL